MPCSPDEISELLKYLTPEERAELDALLAADMRAVPWRPLPGPQSMAFYSIADVVGYGGAAGGGKTDLMIGKSLQHRVIQLFRRQGTELGAIIDRMVEIIGNSNGLSRSYPATWRDPARGVRLVEFGSVPNPGDERKYQGRAKDFLGIDEAANFLEDAIRFLMGWVRTTIVGLHCQTLLCFNPPTTVLGRWIIEFFAPWLDPKHPVPAAPGELRYFAMIAGKELELADSRRFVLVNNQVVYDFEPSKFKVDQIITPKSRTFIPARIGDNPYLVGTNYMAQLQALPEPLRSQMLYGDFSAGMEDDPWQVIPTAWVEAAMSRWKPRLPKPPMDSMGIDVARGGKDNTILSRRHGDWFDELLCYPGTTTPDGPTVAGLVVANARDRAREHIDVIGVGASPYDFLRKAGQPVVGVDMRVAAPGTDKSGLLTFANLRSFIWWGMREALDPANNRAIELPPDRRLLVDLCTPKWESRGKVIQVQSREDILDEIGRSPDYGTAVVLANMNTPLIEHLQAKGAPVAAQREHDPLANL